LYRCPARVPWLCVPVCFTCRAVCRRQGCLRGACRRRQSL
jgi:hypothetical protein